MADISQIKLPNANVFDLKDASAVSNATFSGHELTLVKRGNTMTKVDLGEFDALDVTELNVGDLIATGAARFTNDVFGNLSGNADTATKLATARTIQTNLASTSSASFDGSANITPGITGTLGVGNGGTGQTSAINAANAFINALTTGSSDPQDNDYYISQYVNGGTTTTTYHRRPHSALWNYIKGKINSVIGLNESTYSGTSAKATKANLTTTANAVAYYTDAAGTFGSKASANGALYATSANGALTFGTLPVGQGGTGNTTGTATYATTTADTSSTLYLVGVTSGAPTTLKRDTSITMSGGTITATTFSGALSGNATSATSATTATKATQDESGNNIKATYASGIGISGNTITLKNKNNQDITGASITIPTYTAATATPIMDGTAAVGTSAKYAREDHVHPSDTTKVSVVAGKGLSTEDYTTAEKTKLSGIAEGAEVNQSAFSNVVVGSTTIAADAKTDTLTLTAGSNITLTPDATNDKITIASSYTNTIPSAYCTTAAGTAAKVASCTGYVLRSNNYIQVIITQSNTAASALTLAINGTTAKPIYINNVVSSSSNYTLSAGTYIVYYDGTNYQFRTDARIPGFVNSAYNCYTSSYTDSSELYATGILKAQDSSSYKRVYHSPYIIMSPYALKVKDHSNNITYGVKIDSYDTTSFTSNNVTTYTDGGRIILYNNTYTSESSTPSSNSGVILSGQSNSIIIKQPGTTNTVMQLEGDVGRIRMYRPGYNQNTISLDSRLGSGNPSITISNPADQEYITVLKSDGLITKTHSDNETVKLYTTYTFEVDDDPNSDYFGQYSFGKLEIRNENKVYNNNNTTITTAAMITLDGETGNITAGNFTYKDNNSFTQSAIDALYPSSASSSIDIPASLVATVNSRLDTQDGIIGGLSTSVSALSDTIGIVPSNTTVQGQINTANANITTLTNTLNTMSVNLAHQTLASGSYKASTTNYEYTGVHFTLPSGSTYLIRAAAAYNNGAPIGVAICNSSTTCSASTVIYVHETTTALPCGGTPVYLMVAGTYYLWVKRATVPTGANDHYIYGVRLR